MEKLCRENEEMLTRLLEMEKGGEDVPEFIFKAIADGEGPEADYQNLIDLGAAGMVELDPENYVTGTLTPKGRSYFGDLEDHKAERRKEVWSDRRFQIGLSAFTCGVSILITCIGRFC